MKHHLKVILTIMIINLLLSYPLQLNAQTTATACNNYTWSTNSQTYTASGTYYAVDSSFYRSSASWLSACAAAGLTNSSVETFNSNVSSGSFGSVSVSWQAYTSNNLFYYYGNPTYIQTADRIADSIKITFNPGVSAVAGNFYAAKIDGSCSNDGRTTTLTLSNGYSITYVANNLSQTFRGFIANTGSLITSITINGYLSPSSGKEWTAMDNLQVATGTVPSLNLTINPLPSAPSGSNGSRCSTGQVNISATSGIGETVDWYDVASGGSVLTGGTGTLSFTTPSISTTTTYYAEARNSTSNCVSSTRTAVVATVNPNLPVSASIASNDADNTICSGTSVTFTATPTNGGSSPVYQWKVNGSNVGTNSSSYTTTSLSNNDAVTVELTSNATCATGSPATSNGITTTVNALPSAPTAGNAARCSTGTVSISATPGFGQTIDWYDASTGGSAFSSNSTTYTTPSISSTTAYYALARNTTTGCISATRTAVTATINPVTTSTVSAGGPTTFNYGGSVALSGVLSVPSEGNALSFNGTSNYVSIPSGINSNFSGNQITVEGWFYPTQQSFNTTALISEAYEGDGVVKFTLFSEFHQGVQKIRAGFYSPSTAWVQGTSSTNFSYNQWTHIAATYDQANIKIYVNGALTCTLPNTNALPNGSERWLLGKKWEHSNYFPGKMDEVRIWNVARTQTQIQNSMNSSISPTTSGLVGYYKMDEASGSSAADATGNGYTGTVN